MKVTFKPTDVARTVVPFETVNARMFSSATAESGSPFAGLGYESDAWKAYMEFEICHTLPNIIGPVQEGNYVAYTPQTLAMSHGNLLHQQMNLGHLIKSYDPEKNPRDRIVGCVVATWFPRAPLGGWKTPDSAEAAPAMRCLAVLFKLAEGVHTVLGQHMTSRKKQSVSIECITSLDNIGLWCAGSDVVVPLLKPGEFEPAITRNEETGNIVIGKFDGKQVVMIYGIGRPVDFRGVGVTPRPAERTAKILEINAEVRAGLANRAGLADVTITEFGGGELMSIAAEKVEQTLVGEKFKFASGREGTIKEILTSGIASAGPIRMPATSAKPVMRIVLPDGKQVLRRCEG